MLNTCTFQELERLLKPVLKIKKVPFIQGLPGVGKSSLQRKIADDNELLLLDVRLSTFEPTMINGFLWFKEKTGKAGFMALDYFPLEGDELPINPKTGKPYRGWLLHLDEFTQMPKSVESAAFQLLLDRVVSNRKLHEKCWVVCSGNPQGKGMLSKQISLPMRSRIIHYEMVNTLESFTETMIKLDFHPVIISYLQSEGESMMNNIKKTADNMDGAYACERSWETLSDLVKEIETKNKITKADVPSLTGTVGDVAGAGIYTFFENYYSCPDIREITADPHNTPLPNTMQEQYAAIAYLLSKASLGTGDAISIYIKRFGEEFQMIFGRMLYGKDEKVFDEHFDWITDLIAEYAL